MKHTENQILERAKVILQNLQKNHYHAENIKSAKYHQNEQLLRPPNKILSTWTIVINEPVFDNSVFLTISDETGEPLYIQNKHSVMEIEKGNAGIYQTK